MPLFFSPVYNPTHLLQLQSFFYYLEFKWGGVPLPLSGGVCHSLAPITSLPLPRHTGGGATTPAFSHWLAYLQFMWRSAPLPLCSGECYTFAAVTSLSLSKHTEGGAAAPAFSGQLVYLQFEWRVLLPHSPELRAPSSLCYMYFFCFFYSAACLLFTLIFFSFFPGWGSVCPGDYADADLLCAT
jgi:hypothetical protein